MEDNNTYKKFAPNVWVAQCPEQHQKGEIITLTTRYEKENEHEVHNLVREQNGYFYYSITRVDGMDSQAYAKKRAEKLEGHAQNADKRSAEWQEKSNEAKDFLSLGEPIKIGHHSENRHRNLIRRNWNRMKRAMEEKGKAENYRNSTAYWEAMAKKVNLSMPESIGFFEEQLEQATAYHKAIKALKKTERPHSYSLTYAKKRVKDLTMKAKQAIILWK